MMVAHDWLAYHLKLPQLLPEYGTSIAEYFREEFKATPHILQWSYKVQCGTATSATLLYRHYLTQQMWTKPLILEYPCHQLTYLLAAGYCQDLGFAEYEAEISWPEDNDGLELLVNQLDQSQPMLVNNLRDLSDRLDVTHRAVQQAHDLLSSYQLGYFLHLIAVLLNYEARQSQLSSNPPQALYRTTIDILAAVKGVLFTWRNSKVRH